MRRAAVALVPVGDGRIVAVSRPRPPLRYALPGGTVELGESYEQAARRELEEETGLVADRLVRIHADKRDNTVVVAFLEIGHPTGQLRSSPEGWARLVDPAVITDSSAAWPEFARDVLHAGYAGCTVGA